MSKKRKPPKRPAKANSSSKAEGENIGYGKPPKSGQFQPGRSGNPRGRPKGSRNLATNVRAVLGRKIPVMERGKRRLMAAPEAILHRYLELAIKGDVKAGAFLLNLLDRFQPSDADDQPDEHLSDRDQEIMQNFVAQLNAKQKEK